MRKRIVFRTLTILLAAATLLSSTSAYNLLVYANQEIVSSALSATGTEESYEPNITVQGGELELETNSEGDVDTFSWGTDANGNPANGSQENPYQISSLEHFLQVNKMVNDSTGEFVANPNNKYFVLTADIDISSLTVADFVNTTGNAYFISADHKNSGSQQVYINIDGSYVDENGNTQRHKITGGASGWNIEIPGHQNFSLFGYLGSNSTVQNIIFENINVNVTSASPRQVSIIANKNDGNITNCAINNCSIKSSLNENYKNPYYLVDGVYFYYGIAAAVADNAGTISNVTVNDIAITLSGEDDYIGAIAAQNRGLIDSSAVSGIKVSATINNYYIGGIAGYNESDLLGIRNCTVDMAGANGMTQNFSKGSYVGGLVGSNDGYLYNSSVTGSFTSAHTPTSASYNMLGNVTIASDDIAYYGGAAGVSTGSIVNVTVSDVGFYSGASTAMRKVYFGGIVSTVTAADSVVNCVASGSFAAAEDTNAYAGGIIAYAAADIADGAIKNSYALYKIVNPTKSYVGAVIGWGGKAATLTDCYWSDQISGCATSYVQVETIDGVYSDLVEGAEAVKGNLYSQNRAVIAVRNSNENVLASTLVHRWDGSLVTIDTPSSDIALPTNVPNNTLSKAPYSVKFNFSQAGVGSSDKGEMNVALSIDVFVTTATGDPDDINNPMHITSSAQAKYLYLAPYGHYILDQDVSISSTAWSKPVFTGSINGNGQTIITDTPIFTAVIGARAGDIGEALDTQSYSTDPAVDNEKNEAYLNKGNIKELNVDLSENITASVFGNLINATFVNINLTDGDPADDDGDSATFDGFYATLTTQREATFASAANGYTYIYGCSTNVSTYVEDDSQGNSPNDVAVFIAKLTGSVTVDNCYINANIYICGGMSSNTGRAAFIGNIAANTGYILNSAICTQIIYITTEVSGSHCAVVFGKMDNLNNYKKYKNIVWSKNTPSAVLYPSSYSYDNTQIVLWGGTAAAGGNYSYPEKTVAQGVSATFFVSVPQNIKAFTNVTESDFFVAAESADRDREEPVVEITAVTLENDQLRITVRAKDEAELNSKDYIRIYHQSSGLTTFVRFVVKESGLTYNAEDGYYHVTTSSDIKFLSEKFGESDPNVSGRTYGQAAYYLDADIDMTGITIAPIGNAGIPFSGVFTGPVDTNGAPLYTIYNLTVETTTDNAGLFGAVDFSGSDMTIGTAENIVKRGISNIAISDATVKGKTNTAVLVGYAADPDISLSAAQRDNVYGDVYINNIIIRNSKVYSGTNTETASGRSAAAVLAYAECVNLDISGVLVDGVEVMTYHYPSSPAYFVAKIENGSNYSAGIGGVVGAIHESYRGYNVSETMTVNINSVNVSNTTLSGVNASGTKTYAPVNAGGVVGCFFTQYTSNTVNYATLNIGTSDEGYGINVSDTVIKVKGNAGGVLGAANVITSINGAYVHGSKKAAGAADAETLPMRILGETDYFLGGVAGYVGAKVRDDNNAADGASLTMVYGSVSNSKVENADIRAIIKEEVLANQLTRNVTVGGIVGAINGNKASNAVSSSTVSGSHIEGVVVGGIVGSGVETIGEETGNNVINDATSGNSINIDSCSVLGSEITTINGCIPAAEAYNNWMAYGVGGILGTNRRNLWSYAMHTTVQRCYVDKNTTITNTIAAPAHAATGGILGAGYENGIAEGELVIKYNEVYASIISENNAPTATTVPDATEDYYVTLSATGGLVGALIGFQYSSYEPYDYGVCDLLKISIQHSVFGGSILGTDGIGGAIGVISAASAYNTTAIPTNLLSDIAITGTLASTLDNATIRRGGIAIGHIPLKSNGVADEADDDHVAFDVAAGTDITGAFNKIYFTSFEFDTTKWPVFGYHNATSTTTSAEYSPLAANAAAMLINCYEDVNTKDDNTTLQFNNVESAVTYTLPADQYPAETRPAGVAGAYSVAGQKWYGSNSDIAKVTSSGPNDLTVEPLNSGTVDIAINYVGTVGDSNWSVEVSLPAGFEFKSSNQAPLDYVVVNGETYYLVTNYFDLNIVGKNMTDGADNQGNLDATYLAQKYWIAKDIDLPATLYEANGLFNGGFTPIGTSDLPFTGTFESMPEGTYTSAGGTEYVSDGNMKISGLVFADSTQMGLFAYATGATFKNFTLDNVTAVCTKASASTTNIAYIGAVAATVEDYVTAEGITLSGLNLTGANYTGGLFGGILPGASTSTAVSTIKNCAVVGNTSDEVYSNVLSARYGAAGIVAHTNHNNTNMSGITVADAAITQEYSGTDNAYFDYGAAGISHAFSGSVKAEGDLRNKVIGCSITGEIASGVITRTYNSTSKTAFTLYTARYTTAALPAVRANEVVISNTDVIATKVTGTHATANTGTTYYNYSASGGILARVDASFVDHVISDCTLDSDTYIKAPYGAGGIVGCYESANQTSNTYYAAEYPLTIESCSTYATVEMTGSTALPTNTTFANRGCVGAGAIIGYVGRTTSFIQTAIRDCVAAGNVRGLGNIGGIVGAIWSSNTVHLIANIDHHFAENCVVSAKIEVPDASADGGYVSAFASNVKGAGIVVGHAAYSFYIATNTTYNKYLHATFDHTNYPFYNIYFSDSVYRGDYVRLYGITNSAKNYSLNTYAYYTDYIYNLNRTGTYTIQNNENNVSTVDNASTLSYTDDTFRVSVKGNLDSDKYVYKLNYSYVQGGGYGFTTSTFALDTTVRAEDLFSFDSGASIDAFTVTADTSKGASVTAGSESTAFVLESITCADSRVTITPETKEIINDQNEVIGTYIKYILKTVPLTGGISSELYFNYSNGLTLTVGLEIEIKPEDYWFKESDGVKNLLIFNASNLSFVKGEAGPKSIITQCYDVFWTVSDSAVISAANAAMAGKTLGDVYTDAFIDELASYMHPNPTYDGTEATEEYITFDQMFSTSDTASRRAVLLSDLIGEIVSTSFETYGEDCGAAIYNRTDPFVGEYNVMSATVNTGLTTVGDAYKIYGLELRSDVATMSDAPYAGMFNRIGSGAVISDVSFVNPVINVVNSAAADNYVGVLAGEIIGATVNNVSVTKSGSDDALVSSVRRMTAANTYVGAVAGTIGEGTNLNGITVSGVDVVGASIAGNRAVNADAIKYVYAGGVAGSTDGTLSGIEINNVNVFVNRNESYARGYVSYAGGVAGKASGTVSSANISAVVSGCNIDIEIDDSDVANVVYSANASSEAGDRIGGVVGLASGSLTVEKADLSNIVVNAFDVAGGVVAEVANDENIAVNIVGCDIGSDSKKAQVTVSGTSNIAGATYGRTLYNAAGGVIGVVDNAASVKVTDCDFNGYVGQYELAHKNCTAGGIIALVSENLASLNSIVITTSTVQGEVAGYRRNASSDTASLRILGAAGGIIGKIYNFAYKTFESSDTMISNSIMSAKIDLYNSADGGTVKADYTSLENQNDTNVGKIIGEVRNDGKKDNFAATAGSDADSGVIFTDYVSKVYVSSYPQDIVVYGCNTFYNNQLNDPSDTYIDINREERYMAADAEGPENVSSFMVDSTIADPTVDPSVNPGGDNPYNTGTYSDVAIITFDDDQDAQGTTSSRYFRLAYDNIKLDDSVDKTITFNKSNPFGIYVEDTSLDLTGVTVSANFYNSSAPGLTETVDGTSYSYSYYPGVITVDSNENVDIVGYISASYSYGLEVGIQFVSMEIAGNGTAATPFEVAEPKHFKVVRALRGAYYNQVANIDFADVNNNQYSASTEGAMFASGKGIEPIGSSSAPFTGSYNGQGYVLSNVYIARSDEDNVGLFGYVGTGNNAATLKNIHIELAGELNVTDENSNVTTVIGGITGDENVGGLVGYANNAVITNCSVANGFVMGRTRVGGLVGRTGTASFDSCFTSTSTYSYLTSDVGASAKNVGALIGYVGNTSSVSRSFTLGLASVGTTSTSGVAGGLVGYVNSGTLTIADSLVGATVSDYTGISEGSNTYKGMTVGQAATISNVVVGNTTIAAPRAIAVNDTSFVNPVVGGITGAGVTNVFVDTELVGALNGSEEYSPVTKTDAGLYSFSVSSDDDVAGDAYTAAYVALAVIPIEVDPNEVSDRETYKNPGFYYPVTLDHGGEYTFSSSIIDQTDTVEYPNGLDADMYGVKTAGGVNKNTDLLFRDTDGATTVYSNVYSDTTAAVLKDGTVYPNGEVAYDSTLPYFNVSKTASVKGSAFEITRKVVYPVQSRFADAGTSYPIATARQLFALSNSAECVTGSKFYDFYTLNSTTTSPGRNYTVVADIDLGGNNFNPIVGYSGTFNGNGYTVDNLVIDMPGSNEVGLFRTLSDATVKNLTVGVKKITGNDNIGGLVGAIITDETTNSAYNAMVNVYNCHSVQSDGGEGIVATGSNVGGLVGAATRSSDTYFINESSSSVNVSGYDVVGGLVGYSEQPIKNSYATGNVSAEFTSFSAVTQIHPWIINGTQPIAGTPLSSAAEHGVGGLAGVISNSESTNNVADAVVDYCFGSGIVTVTNASYEADGIYGVGGLVGVNCAGTKVSTSFSSGNVYYCYGNNVFASCSDATVGVGGLVGVIYSELNDVYSSASIAADFGDVTSADAVGAGGIVGVAYSTLSFAYSSGATLGTTTTIDYSSSNYGAGGVIGVLDSGTTCANLIFDLNLSITDQVAGKILSGEIQESNSGAKTTRYLTTVPENDQEKFMSPSFGYVEGAYPYLTNFFKNDVSLTIRINALLSVVALQLNDLDTSAANGDGISMALNIPTEFTYTASGTDDSDNEGKYAYSYSDRNNLVDAAQGIIDIKTNTLSIQRTQNEAQYVNFVITIASKDDNTADENGTVYSEVANRLVSRLCAPMLGTSTHPYLVATQEDLSHVGMTNDELSTATGMYRQWATPILENGTPTSGVVNFRLMGYVPLDGYNRTIADLTGQTYSVEGQSVAYEGISFDGNGYSIRNLQTRLFNRLDSSSKLSNMTFEDVAFASNSLIGEVDGLVEGVNVYGTASGSNTAAIASAVNKDGKIIGSVAKVDYTDAASTSNIAGIAITNNGTIELCASVANFSGSAVSGMGAMVVTNNGVISNSFTIGNLMFDDAQNLGGFVNNNTENGSIQNCYTRCNIVVNNTDASRVIGGFAAQNSGTIEGAYSAGMFDLATDTSPLNIFVAKSTGTLEDCMFDKQMSGSRFSDIYDMAERTLDIVTLVNHPGMKSSQTLTAYTVSEPTIDAANERYLNVYYPQLTSILNTYAQETKVDEDGNETQVETVRSRMYRVLRAYSFVSSATALVGNDNYIDNLALGSSTPLSYDSVNNNLWRKTSGSDAATVTFYGTGGSDIYGRKILAGDTAGTETSVISALYEVTDFYDIALDDAQLDIFAKVTGAAHPNFAGGQGTETEPFVISAPEHVVALSFYGSNADNHFIVNNDIDMSSANWTSYIDNFKADLNGNGKVFSNVTIGEQGNDSLFGTVNGGKIDGLGVAGINVAVTGTSGGMLASSASSGASITNSYVVGTLTTSTSTEQINIGGLVGEIDGATVDGCIVSGKIVSDASTTGGVVGSALDGSVIKNVLSTVYVDGGSGVAAGIVGAADGAVEIASCVFASDVKAETAGNITGDGRAVDSCFYDKQMSSVTDSAASASTHYLTSGATMDQLGFGTSMTRLDSFAGYPVPASFANTSAENGFVPTEQFLAGVKLASAKISLASGAGAGTINSFTNITAPSALGTGIVGKLSFGGGSPAYLVNVTDTQIDTDTSTLALGDVVNRYVTYTFGNSSFDGGKMLRYLDLYVGKTMKVTYNFVDLESDANAVLTVFSGMTNISAVTAFAVSGKHSGEICSSMVIPYDSDEQAYVLRVGSELPSGKAIEAVSAEVRNNGAKVLDAQPTQLEDGTWKLAMVSDTSIECDEIVITVTVEDDSVWGIHKYFNLF